MDELLDGENGVASDGSACVGGDKDDSIADESADDSDDHSYESSNASSYSSSQEESSDSYDSSDSSIDSYSSDESASSSSSNKHTTLNQDTTDPKCQSNNVFRRRRRSQQYTSTATESSSNSRGQKMNPNNKRRQCNNTTQYSHSMSTVVHRSILYSMYTSSKSTKLLCTSFILWGCIQLYIMFRYSFYNDGSNDYYTHDSSFHSRRGGGGGMSGRQKKAMARNHRETTSGGTRINTMEALKQQAKAALGTAAKSSDDETFYKPQPGKPNTRRRGHRSKNDSTGNTRSERLRDGCSPLEWHEYHYPNCNEIHEIDLRDVVKRRRFGVDLRSSEGSDTASNAEDGSTNSNNNNFPWGFVGNGLWRDVFSCDPHQEIGRPYTTIMAPAVLKIMKSEHPYDQRNFQRHRRDALVMELLSSSHHLVPIYGYCANAVLTKAISHTLDDVIYAREKERVKSWSPEGGYRTKPKIESWMGRDAATGELLATRETELGRIRLALGVFRGLMDLHQGVGYKNKEGKMVEWLPIIHADLQAKQYLVDSTTGDVYLNDFNRCRFVTKRDENNTDANATTLESCPVYIPTAPGSARSPEEYDSAPLSEKLDVYSAGNILYGIITGERPWDDQRGKHIKASIQRGDRPEVNETIRNAAGTVDAELSRLLDRVYEGDPVKRASAKEIVQE